MDIKEEDRVFGNVTWDDLFTRKYWDIRYDGHACTPVTRQDYPKDICEKIIQRILQNQKLKKLVSQYLQKRTCGCNPNINTKCGSECKCACHDLWLLLEECKTNG